MGSVKIDVDKGARTYAVRYVLNDAAGVKKLLRDRHAVSSARYSGDYNAADILLDLNNAINSAGLTDAQTEVVAWLSGADQTQRRTAELMGITQQAVAKTYDAACAKIATVYKRWEYGEVAIEYDIADEEEAA